MSRDLHFKKAAIALNIDPNEAEVQSILKIRWTQADSSTRKIRRIS